MSNVLERFRSISEMEFYSNAEKLRDELRSFLLNQKNVPKKDRMIYSYPVLTLVQEMIDKMVAANKIYAYTPEQVEKRKSLFQEALDLIDPIYQRFQSAVKDLWREKLQKQEGENGYVDRLRLEGHIATVGQLLVSEEKLLKGCIRKTKQLKN